VNGGLAGAGIGGETSALASCERMIANLIVTGETVRFEARPRVVREHHLAVLTSPKAVRGSRDRGYEARATAIALVVVGHRILRRVLTDGRHPGSKEASSFYGAAWRAVLAAPSPKGPARAPKRSRADFRKKMHARRCMRPKGKRERRQGCQRLGPIEHRGKKTPTPVHEVGDDLGSGRSTEVESVFDGIRRSGSSVVKRSFLQSCCAEPKTLRSVRPVQIGRVSWKHARCGCSKSFEWQTSVGRIARLGRREVERPGGEPGALAGRKLVTLLTKGCGRLEGETVRGSAILTRPRSRLADLGLQALEHDGRRSRTTGRQAFTGRAIRSPLTPRSNAFASSTRKGGVARGERIGRYGYRLGRA
jgi:hypothetical protein